MNRYGNADQRAMRIIDLEYSERIRWTFEDIRIESEYDLIRVLRNNIYDMNRVMILHQSKTFCTEARSL